MNSSSGTTRFVELSSNPSKNDISCNSLIELSFLIIYALQAVVIFLGNLLTCAIFLSKRQLRQTYMNIFLINLAIADILVALTVFPGYTSFCSNCSAVKLDTKDNVCDYLDAIKDYTLLATIVGILAITFDRYVAVLQPLRYRCKLTEKTVIALIALTWTLPLPLATLKQMLNAINPEILQNKSYAHIYDNVLIFTCIILPMIVIAIVNGRITKAIRSQVAKVSFQGNPSLSDESRYHDNANDRFSDQQEQRCHENTQHRVRSHSSLHKNPGFHDNHTTYTDSSPIKDLSFHRNENLQEILETQSTSKYGDDFGFHDNGGFENNEISANIEHGHHDVRYHSDILCKDRLNVNDRHSSQSKPDQPEHVNVQNKIKLERSAVNEIKDDALHSNQDKEDKEMPTDVNKIEAVNNKANKNQPFDPKTNECTKETSSKAHNIKGNSKVLKFKSIKRKRKYGLDNSRKTAKRCSATNSEKFDNLTSSRQNDVSKKNKTATLTGRLRKLSRDLRERNGTRSCLIIVVIFIVCWIPRCLFNIFQLLIPIGFIDMHILEKISFLFLFFQSLTNPLVYSLYRRDFKLAAKGLWRRISHQCS